MLATYSQTPDLSALDRSPLADGTRAKYRTALLLLIASNVNPMDASQLQPYAATLAPSARKHLKAGLKIMYSDLIQRIKSSVTPATLPQAQTALLRLEAMDDAIPTDQPARVRLPHWLTQEQVTQLLALAFEQSLRDYIVLALLVCAGLRREEATELTFDGLRSVDGKNILHVTHTKGDKPRTVPIQNTFARHLQEWQAETGVGKICRKIDRHGNIGKSLSPAAIFDICRKYGRLLGIDDLDPHDLRRTYGRLVYQQTGDIVFVRDLLGHADAQTTQNYIGVSVRTDAPRIMPGD